jgi:hypothetical protein
VTVSIARQIQCAEREISMRRAGFPHMVRKQRMTQAEADDEMAACEAILATLRGLLAPAALRSSKPVTLYFETDEARTEFVAWLAAQGHEATVGLDTVSP